jgi:hypothetical protein
VYVIACAVCWIFLVIETHAVQFAQVTLLAQISLENAIVAIGNGPCICTRIRSTHIHPGVNSRSTDGTTAGVVGVRLVPAPAETGEWWSYSDRRLNDVPARALALRRTCWYDGWKDNVG